jgi:tRNA-2-methylthio-N6-dimethylallyladenosine synthase
MRYYLWTIGCQMNFADSRQAAEELEKLGYSEASQPKDADLILLNTCVVRQSAEDKVVGRLTSLQGLKRRQPDLRLALMGCYVNEIPALQDRYPFVDAFIKPSDIPAVLDLAKEQLATGLETAAGPHALAAESQKLEPELGQLATAPPVVAGIPISQGCDHLCTYCIVRLRRGPEVSRPIDEIVAEVQDLARRGVKEITLLGQNVDSYGHDLPPGSWQTFAGRIQITDGGQEAIRDASRTPDLADLLEAVHTVPGLERIRFLTSHPADMTERLIEAVGRLPKVCEHIELPIQSGDNTILRRMGRGYTVESYRELVGVIREILSPKTALPGVQGLGLATDVIVGFPGETEAQFQATYRLLEELRFDMVHVAAYSPRPGTPAEKLQDSVPAAEKERRRKAIDNLQEQIVGEINAALLGQTVEVLVEGRHKGRWRGRTRTNKLVFFEVDEQDWTGSLAQVRITRTGPWSMQGTIA